MLILFLPLNSYLSKMLFLGPKKPQTTHDESVNAFSIAVNGTADELDVSLGPKHSAKLYKILPFI